MIATHHSLTYLPTAWYNKPLKFIYQTQDRSIEQQYADGIRMFDFRIAFKKNKPIAKHGTVSFKGDIFEILSFLNQYKDCYVMITLEENKNFDKFYKFCENIVASYPNITFYGGASKSDWNTTIYSFKPANVPYVRPCNQSRWQLGICPRVYAKKHNKENIAKYKDVMIDFYEIQ